MRKLTYLFVALAAMFLAVPVYAQATPGVSPETARVAMWVAITSGFAMAIVSSVCGIGQSKATAAAAEALARNPAARPGIQIALFIGLALIESLALYTLVIIFVKVSVPAYLQPK
jgi:F-type H+-transporting ATPase subunit c